MQNIDLICVGKLNAKYFAEGVAEYQKRLAAFASFRIIELPEEKIEEKNASDAVVKKALEKEGKAILSNVRKGAAIVALCIEGKRDLLGGAGPLPGRPRRQRGRGCGLRHRLVPRAGRGGQAGGGAQIQHGPHHDAPSAGPPCADGTALPRLHHQCGHEIPQVTARSARPPYLGTQSIDGAGKTW